MIMIKTEIYSAQKHAGWKTKIIGFRNAPDCGVSLFVYYTVFQVKRPMLAVQPCHHHQSQQLSFSPDLKKKY